MSVKTDTGNQQHFDSLKNTINNFKTLNNKKWEYPKSNNLYEILYNAAKLVGFDNANLKLLKG